MSEEHAFSLIIASTAIEAKKKAKKRWISNVTKKHNDDCSNIERIDDLHTIKIINNWEVLLIPDSKKRNQVLIPDWNGYMRIDKF